MRILLIDEQEIPSWVDPALVRLGYSTERVTAPQVRRALSTETFSVVLLSGLDLLGELPQLSPGTLALFVANEEGIRDYQRALRLGAAEVLIFPFIEQELIEAMNRAVDCLSGFRGSIHGLSLVDMIQLFHLSRRSVVLEVQGSEGAGTVVLYEGELVDAEAGGFSGENALLWLLAQDIGAVRSLPFKDPSAKTFQGTFQEILFETLRRLDEGDLPTVLASSKKLVARARLPSGRPRSSFPPGEHLASLRGALAATDPEISAMLVWEGRFHPISSGNIEEGALYSLAERFWERACKSSLFWEQLHWFVRQGGACLLRGNAPEALLLARRWRSSSEQLTFQRNISKINRVFSGAVPANSEPRRGPVARASP